MDRRRFIATTLAAATPLVAGCSGSTTNSNQGDAPTETDNSANSPSSNSEEAVAENPNSKTFEEVSVGTEIDVTLKSDADIDSLRLVTADGSEQSSASVNTGVQSLTVPIVDVSYLGKEEQVYKPGEYKLLAINGEEVVDEHPVSLTPELTVTGVSSANGSTMFELENVGSGPAYLWEFTTIESDETMSEELDSARRISGETEDKTVPPGETREVSRSLFGFGSLGTSHEEPYCTGEGEFKQETTFAVKVANQGWHTGTITVLGGGEVKTSVATSNEYCSEITAESLPVELSLK